MGMHAALGLHRREKIFFYAPFAFQFRRKIDNVHRAIAKLREHYFELEKI